MIPTTYKPKLDYVQTQQAIKLAKDTFEKKLSTKLDLLRVSAPRFILDTKGLQDDLAQTQESVKFHTKFSKKPIEVVHSLAKWKRYTLGKHKFKVGKGIVTHMDAIRKDEDVSPIHSIYVDQWDWERVIGKEQRTIDYLKSTVKQIYQSIKETKEELKQSFPQLTHQLPEQIHFVTTLELEKSYPTLTPKQREHAIAKELGAVFIIGIGHKLKSGEPHDVRAADYDDWYLCGDILVYDKVRDKSLELSSMGIRVDETSLAKQLELSNLEHRKELEYHKSILEKTMPLTIGGGIGMSRMCMFLLEKAHIAQVQSSVWPQEVHEEFTKKGVIML
jgi:aspartate--ammonia ligase